MEFSEEELKLLEHYVLCELDTQRYEPDGIDEELENIYIKLRDRKQEKTAPTGDTYYVLRSRHMTFGPDGAPMSYSYHDCGSSDDRAFLEKVIRDYNLKVADDSKYFDDGYEIIEKHVVTPINMYHIKNFPKG